MMKLAKSGDVQLLVDISFKMGIYKSLDKNSLYNELSMMSPCTLYLKVEELILHPKTSRNATNHEKKPYSSTAPKPQNKFIIFRRNFIAKFTKDGRKLKKDELGVVSRLAGDEWNDHPEFHWYFEILENLAKREHAQEYGDCKFLPKKGGKKSNNKANSKKSKKPSEKTSLISDTSNLCDFRHYTGADSATNTNNSLAETADKVNREILDCSEFFDFDSYYSQY